MNFGKTVQVHGPGLTRGVTFRRGNSASTFAGVAPAAAAGGAVPEPPRRGSVVGGVAAQLRKTYSGRVSMTWN